MPDDLKQTVRIVRKPKVATDERGHTVWADPVETVELDLVSTTMLKNLLDADDDTTRQRIEKAAEGKDGVLAHDAERDRFEIIDDDDLQAALDSAASAQEPVRPADVVLEPLADSIDDDEEELSLVSTQMLRKMLAGDEPDDNPDSGDEPGDGFDPYNSS